MRKNTLAEIFFRVEAENGYPMMRALLQQITGHTLTFDRIIEKDATPRRLITAKRI